MNVVCLGHGVFDSNSYILYQGDKGVLIDAGVSTEDIVKKIDELSISLQYIILTHGHIDHIYNAFEVKEKTGALIVAHKDEVLLLKDPIANCSYFLGDKEKVVMPDILVEDNDTLDILEDDIKIIHTPGHTAGGISIKCRDVLFSGDTLFKDAVGRTDLETGNMEDLYSSIEKLYKLDDKTIVYPGHGESTTIGLEKRNQFFGK